MRNYADTASGGGCLMANIMHFGRVLRAAGLPIGPGTVLDAVNALRAVGVADRDDFYWTLHAVFVNRFPHRELFDQAFHVFWRNPRLLERMMSMVLPSFNYSAEGPQAALRRRLSDALQPGRGAPPTSRHRPGKSSWMPPSAGRRGRCYRTRISSR